jgi:hypothetical protein
VMRGHGGSAESIVRVLIIMGHDTQCFRMKIAYARFCRINAQNLRIPVIMPSTSPTNQAHDFLRQDCRQKNPWH